MGLFGVGTSILWITAIKITKLPILTAFDCNTIGAIRCVPVFLKNSSTPAITFSQTKYRLAICAFRVTFFAGSLAGSCFT